MKVFVGTGFFLALSAAAQAAAPGGTPDVTAPIHQFIDGFNRGDSKTGYAAYAAGMISITDEFSPHLWIGTHAAQNWAADYDKNAAKIGVTDGWVSYGKPSRSQIDGNTAYVIIPAHYTYKQKAIKMAEDGQMAFVLHGGKDGWKIQGWSWAGTMPQAAK
jgi:hypothetical protein